MPQIRIYPVTISIHTALRLHVARPWGVFRQANETNYDFYIADYAGPPFVFSNYRSINLSGDDFWILVTGEYWRCSGGQLYMGSISTDEVLGAETLCTGFANNYIRSICAWKKSDNTYGLIYLYDENVNDDGVQGHIKQASSDDGIAWSGVSNVLTTEICDEQALIYESNQAISGAGSFEFDDAYVLEKLSVVIGSNTLRMLRIGRKNRYDVSGNFSDYEGWTALGDENDEDTEIAFTDEGILTVTGQDLSQGNIQILQLIRA